MIFINEMKKKCKKLQDPKRSKGKWYTRIRRDALIIQGSEKVINQELIPTISI